MADKTPTAETTPESYVGYEEEQYDVGTTIVHDKAIVYHAPITVPLNSFAFDGTWTDHSQEATAGSDASIDLHFVANDVYLVMGGTGTVVVSFDGRHLTTVDGERRAAALHAVLRECAADGTAGPRLLSGRAGLRLHLRLSPSHCVVLPASSAPPP